MAKQKRFTDYDQFTDLSDDDILLGVDVSDTTDSAEGSTKRLTVDQIGRAIRRTILLTPTGDETGQADDALFDAAHAQLEAAGGGVIEYAAGTFYTASPRLVTADNIGIKGQGIGISKLVAASGFSGVGLGGSSIGAIISFCSVSNFFCIGMDVDAHTNNVKCNGIQNVPIGFPSGGTPCSHGLIAHNRVRLKANDHVYHIWNMRGQNVCIAYNDIDGNSTTKSQQEGIELYGGKNVLVFGNTVKNIGNVGLFVSTVASAAPNCELEDIRIIGNDVDGCAVGCQIHPTYDATNGDMHAKRVIVKGNILRNVREHGIWLRNSTANATTESVSILGNVVYCDMTNGTASYRGLRVSSDVATSSFNMTNVVIQGNQFHGSTATSGANLYMLRAKNVKCTNNTGLVPTPLASLLGAQLNACENVTFESNTIDGAGQSGISLVSCNGVAIRNNEVLNYAMNTTTSGLLVGSSGENLDITDNVFDTAATPLVSPINIANANTYYVRGNRFRNILGSLESNAMINFGSGKGWTATTAYNRKQIARATSGNTDFYFECVDDGTTGATEPTWNVGEGAITTDGSVKWVCRSVH